MSDKTAKEKFLKTIEEAEEGTSQLIQEVRNMGCDSPDLPMILLMCGILKNLANINTQIAYVRLEGLGWSNRA